MSFSVEPSEKMIVGNSEAILRLRETIQQVANSSSNVLICGETGVGKGLVAQTLHLMSDRKDRQLVRVNCAAIPDQLLESELFGFEKGAFTGAHQTNIGRFELAHLGTILLDEIGDMPLTLQSKILHVLEDFYFSRLGGNGDIKVDCRVLATTNHNLEQCVEEGRFRKDLYYRLNTVKISIPPLRERSEDIEPLLDYFSRQIVNSNGKRVFKLNDNGVFDFLCQYSWPGNVRELKNVVENLMLLGDWPTVREELLARQTDDIDANESKTELSSTSVKDNAKEMRLDEQVPSLKEVKKRAVQEAEAQLIESVLRKTDWNRKEAANILQVSYKALLYKIKEYGLNGGNGDTGLCSQCDQTTMN
jgi:two-component system response regulator AtoC